MKYTTKDLIEIIEHLENKIDVLQRQVNHLNEKCNIYNLNQHRQSPPFMSIGDGACYGSELDL